MNYNFFKTGQTRDTINYINIYTYISILTRSILKNYISSDKEIFLAFQCHQPQLCSSVHLGARLGLINYYLKENYKKFKD